MVMVCISINSGCSQDYDTTRYALIQGGTFRMGNISDDPPPPTWERPVHEVTITRPFLMGRTEVTQEQYQAVMGIHFGYFKGEDLPVECVSWYDALDFCNALSELEGLEICYFNNFGSRQDILCDFTANGYRLPTEAEWEYACRAGTETDFHTDNMAHSDSSPLDPALDRAGWYDANSGGATQPVGEKEPNAFGLYDMHGNVAEWCWDRGSNTYYAVSPDKDPRGPESDSYSNRICRGGTWGSSARGCLSAYRDALRPDRWHSGLGFRVVRTY